MEQASMTALVSAFSRAYHAQNNDVKIFDDSAAKYLLTSEEYEQIAKLMTGGIKFFDPSCTLGEEQALRHIVDSQLSPTPLARAAWAEKSLETAARVGTRQYLILGAGFDTFAYRQSAWANALEIFELDRPTALRDKRERIERSALTVPGNVHYVEADFADPDWPASLLAQESFRPGAISFCSLLGVSYYLSAQEFCGLVSAIGALLPVGSSLALDYPDENYRTERAGERAKKQTLLASGANEKMLLGCSYGEMEKLLADRGFLIYEHLDPAEMTAQYFDAYNRAYPERMMTAFDNVNYCLAVRR